MVPLPTYQVPISTNFGYFIDAARATNKPEISFGANVTTSQPVHVPEAGANDISLVSVSRLESSTIQEPDNSVVLALDTQTIFVSRPTSFPHKTMNDISENPSWSPLSCPAPISRMSITVPLNVRITLVRLKSLSCSVIIVMNARLQ